MVNCYNTTQLTDKAPKISIANGQITQVDVLACSLSCDLVRESMEVTSLQVMYSLPLLIGDMRINKQHVLMVTMVRMDTADTVRNAQVEGKVRAAWHHFQVLELVSFPAIMSELEEANRQLAQRKCCSNFRSHLS